MLFNKLIVLLLSVTYLGEKGVQHFPSAERKGMTSDAIFEL
jgi:hypothetical protein